MSDKDQAQADLPEDEMTVVDPLEDITSNPTPGLEELNEYEEIVNSALETPAEEEEQGDKPAAEEVEEEVTEEQSEEENTAEVIEEETEESSREEDSTPNRFRIRAKDELEAEALALRKRHPDWSLEDCLNKAKSVLGVDQKQGEQEQSSSSEPVETVDSITQQIKDLTAKKADAMRSMEFEEVADIDGQLEELREKREGLRINEVQAKARHEQSQMEQFERAYTESERKAVTFYPDTAKADSEMVKRMIEIDRFMRDNGDPIYHSPDKPFILAKQAASELGIPMTRPAAAGTKPKTTTASKSPIQPASGNARTTPAAPAPKLEERLQEVDSEEGYEELVTSLTRRA